MNRLNCSGDWLVEYADGDLPADLIATADDHLTSCQRCRSELAALRRSREMLAAYFVVADRPPVDIAATGGKSLSLPNRRPWLNLAAGALASAAALLLAVYFFQGWGQAPEKQIVKTEPVAKPPVVATKLPPTITPDTVPAESDDADDVMAQIRRETQIARLRAASQILAKEPGMHERHLALEKYLSDVYGVTDELPPSM